jgi:hypothetical protein
VVHTASKLKAPEDEDFTMYDAVPESNASASKGAEPLDPEMDKFLPMLEEYLRGASVRSLADPNLRLISLLISE